jgi:deferrochelatase/peroxidase EfeB
MGDGPGSGRRLTRRSLLGGAAVAGGGLALAGGGYALGTGDDATQAGAGSAGAGTGSVPFHGVHQPGILTAQQDRLHFAAFDLTSDRPEDLRDLLRTWTAMAARLQAGLTADADAGSGLAPPTDTGEAAGLLASRLTLTIGLGPGLFEDADGHDRLGLAARRPRALRPLPALPGDELRADISGGDLCVQACADDPQVAFHAVRNLARAARGIAVMRWSQLGFGRTSSTSRAQETPRNLMGFKDGTNNLTAEDPQAELDGSIWHDPSDRRAPWMAGGSYLVSRRIRMLIEVWDRASLDDQEATIGRVKLSGAPLGAHRERDALPLDRRGSDGKPVIPVDAHVRLAAPEVNEGIRILRRGYSFTDGFDAELGQLDAGLFFLAYMRDPHRQFVPLQERLGSTDALNEYIKHVSSGIFAIPPGVPDIPGRFLGDGLFIG